MLQYQGWWVQKNAFFLDLSYEIKTNPETLRRVNCNHINLPSTQYRNPVLFDRTPISRYIVEKRAKKWNITPNRLRLWFLGSYCSLKEWMFILREQVLTCFATMTQKNRNGEPVEFLRQDYWRNSGHSELAILHCAPKSYKIYRPTFDLILVLMGFRICFSLSEKLQRDLKNVLEKRIGL